jgi:phosphoribosyl 1,2-cyclic phosphate phosphodiesterase
VFDLVFLGTGTSTGVPVIGCECDVCRSSDPRDARLRASILLRAPSATILVDTSPDLRIQMLLARPPRIDAVIFTHAHADHTAGLDELRRFNVMQLERIPVWATEETATDLRRRFSYAFDHSFSFFGGKPDLDLHLFDPTEPFTAAGVEVVPIPVNHGRLPIVGYRIGGLVYVTDVKTIPDSSRRLLDDADVMIMTALRRKAHVAHMNLDEALATITRHRPKRAYLTHLAHEMGRFDDVAPLLPASVELATDGLVVSGITMNPRFS